MSTVCLPSKSEVEDGVVKDEKPMPLLLRMREKIGGRVVINPQCSDSSTYMGSTQCPGSNGVADYQSD